MYIVVRDPLEKNRTTLRSNAPTVIHNNYETALREAERLTVSNLNVKFFVAKLLCSFEGLTFSQRKDYEIEREGITLEESYGSEEAKPDPSRYHY